MLHKEVCTNVYSNIVYNTKTWKTLKCPLTKKEITRSWCITQQTAVKMSGMCINMNESHKQL